MPTNRVTVVIDGQDNLSGVVNGMMGNMQGMGQGMTSGLTKPIVGFGVAAAKAAGDFESSMNQVKVLTQAGGKELAAMEDQAKLLGRTTQFSATQVGDAMAFMGATGYDANQILETTPHVMNLAAATNTDVAKTADKMTNAMQGYGIAAKDAGRFSDVVTKAFTSSNLGTDISGFATSMEYVGPVAKAAGYEFEQTTALLGKLGDAGYQGSKAGTILRGSISNLMNPVGQTAKAISRLGLETHDSSGKLLPMTDIIGQLEDKGASTADVMQLFGKVAGPGMLALLAQGQDGLEDYQASLKGVEDGFAGDVAAVQMQGLNGALKGLGSAWEGLMIAVGDSGFTDFLTGAVQGLTSFVQGLAGLNPQILKWGTLIAGVVAAIGPLLLAIGGIVTMVPVIVTGFGAVAGILGAVGAAITAVGAPILLIGAGIAAAAYLIITNWSAVKSFFATLWTSFASQLTVVQPLLTQMGSMFMATGQALMGILGPAVQMVVGMFSALGSRMAAIMPTGQQIFGLATQLASILAGTLGAAVNTVAGGFMGWVSAIQSVVGALSGLISKAASAASAVKNVMSGAGGFGGLGAMFGGAATGYLPSTGLGGLIGAAIRERSQAPGGSQLLLANSSEAILNQDQQQSLASSLRGSAPVVAPAATGGGGGNTFAPQITVNASPGMDVEALAQAVMGRIEEEFREFELGYLT